MDQKLQVEVVSGAAGPALYINGYRVAGPKPFGGGRTIHQWYVDAKELAQFAPAPAPSST